MTDHAPMESILCHLFGCEGCLLLTRLRLRALSGVFQKLPLVTSSRSGDYRPSVPSGRILFNLRVRLTAMAEKRDWFSPGTLISNRFTILKRIGKGGMGVVCLAHDTRLEKDVALKFLAPKFHLDKGATARLRRETLKSLELTHPNIVRIYDFHEPVDTPAFIAMEYVNGLTVREFMDRQATKTLSWEWTSRIAAPLGKALVHAHSLGIIHRDLKPGNILITFDGDIKLSDFGVSAQIHPENPNSNRGIIGAGTVTFMSPEQMRTHRASVADDIYSLGATLYSMLTGFPPFHQGDIEFQVRHEAPPSIPSRLAEFGIRNEIPDNVIDAIMQCLEKQFQDRPHSVLDACSKMNLNLNSITNPPPLSFYH